MVFPKNFAISSSLKGNDDCYFYFYSSCMKGDECPFRHCKQALGTETVCTLWEEGRCFRANCKFRHMKSSVNRSQISCYWENQPGGCRKPHCVFFHRKLKNGGLSSDENQSLILPVSSGKISPVPSSLPELKIISTPLTNTSRSDKSFDETDEGIHSPVEPFVLSIGENEESDSESVSSTPVKSNESKLTNPINDKNNLAKLSDKTAAKSLDFGIKSLEQIRLEKIHKESADIYKTDDLPDNGIENFFHDVKQNSALPSESVFSYPEYKVPSLEDYKLQRCLEADVKYPLTSDFVPLQPVSTMDVEQIDPNKELALASLKHDNDLRSILNSAKKKSPVTNFLKDEPAKKLVNYKKKINASDNEPPKKLVNYKRNNNSSDSPLDFKIKTLDEIRKEKELKKNINSVENGSCMINNQGCVVNQNHFTNKVQSITIKKLKINRRSEDSTTDSAKKVKRRGDSLDGTGAKMLKLDLYVPSVQQNDLYDQVQTKSDVEKTSKEPCLQNTEDSCLETSYFSKADEPSTMKVIKQSEETSDQVVGSSDCKDESDCQNASLNSSCSPVESSLLIVEADSSSKIDIDNESAKESIENISVNSRTSAAASENSVNRLLSIDELDHFLKDTDVNMDDLDETVDAGEDDIMLKINELLDS